jgi:hypothetical protein
MCRRKSDLVFEKHFPPHRPYISSSQVPSRLSIRSVYYPQYPQHVARHMHLDQKGSLETRL